MTSWVQCEAREANMRAHKNGLHRATVGAIAALAISAATSFTAWADTEVRVIATGEPYGAHPEHRARIPGTAGLQVAAEPLQLEADLVQPDLQVYPLLGAKVFGREGIARDVTEALAECQAAALMLSMLKACCRYAHPAARRPDCPRA